MNNKTKTKWGFLVRTGGGLKERVFGMYGDRAEAEEISAEDKAEGHVGAPAANLREGRKKAKILNGMAEDGGRESRFDLVLVAEDSDEYRRLYKQYLADCTNSKPLFVD